MKIIRSNLRIALAGRDDDVSLVLQKIYDVLRTAQCEHVIERVDKEIRSCSKEGV